MFLIETGDLAAIPRHLSLHSNMKQRARLAPLIPCRGWSSPEITAGW